MRNLGLVLLIFFSPGVWADEVKTLSELALLPSYCKGTQLIRQISKDPVPIEQYMEIYGAAYYHLHHYCWALNTENNALRINDAYLRNSKLNQALVDYKYFLDRAAPNFSLLPEVHISRAKLLFTLKRNEEAVMDLNTAIRLKPDYSLAYARLGDYYQSIGDKNNAIKILEQGISYTRNPQNVVFFMAKLEKLGKPFQGIPGAALQDQEGIAHDRKVAEKTTGAGAQASQADSAAVSAVLPEAISTSQPEQNIPAEAVKANPYCRFCP
ncbi:MAG: hypothetical protein V4443_01350 [Pseudomonadota bacterium]